MWKGVFAATRSDTLATAGIATALALVASLRFPLLPPQALVEGGHRQLSGDQRFLGRSIPDVFSTCSMVARIRTPCHHLI